MSNLNIEHTTSISSPTPDATPSKVDLSALLPLESEAGEQFTRAVEQFTRILGDSEPRHDLDSGQSYNDDSPQPTPSMPSVSSLFSMSNPLDALFSGTVEQVPPTQNSLSEADLVQIVNKILVSTPDTGGSEIRLTLGGNMLQGTEIIIQRDLTGKLFVELNANNDNMFQTLVEAQSSLKKALDIHEKSDVRVQVTQDSGREENDTGRRSRGYSEENETDF